MRGNINEYQSLLDKEPFLSRAHRDGPTYFQNDANYKRARFTNTQYDQRL
jgi:hypothetical protein